MSFIIFVLSKIEKYIYKRNTADRLLATFFREKHANLNMAPKKSAKKEACKWAKCKEFSKARFFSDI